MQFSFSRNPHVNFIEGRKLLIVFYIRYDSENLPISRKGKSRGGGGAHLNVTCRGGAHF